MFVSYFILMAAAYDARPETELQAALADLSTRVAPGEHATTRYLSLYAVPPSKRRETAAVVSFVLNSVSRAASLYVPESVPDCDGCILRVSLARYGLPPETWEAIAGLDPYWHIQTQVVEGDSPNLLRGLRKFGTVPGPVKTVYTDGGWLDLAAAARLRAMTGSGGAVLRADFFLAKAATTAGGGIYYQLAGVPEREADFFKELGIDLPTIDALGADEGANLIYSLVTRKVRRVVRRQGPLGGAWQTYDVQASTPERDPLRRPFAFEFDASELIASRRNGLHLFALYDRQGRRQDSVPDAIAKDTSDPHGAGIIVPMLSCVRCHVEDGLRPFVNDQRRLLEGRVTLAAERPENADRLTAFYLSNIARRLERDRDDYAAAVAACTGGLTPAEVARALGEAYRAYVDDLVTPEQAARELGISPTQLVAALSASDDPVILALCEGLAVQRQQWESSYAQAAVLGEQYRNGNRR